jgi:glucokinase
VLAVRDHAAQFQDRGVRGIGVCVPGLLCDDLAAVEFCPNTPVLAGYPLLTSLRENTGLEIALEVDCNAAALAESRFGAGVGSQRVVVISLGTGVGVGFVNHGTILRLTGGCCGDLGHIYVGGDRKCSAGCRGCLEASVSVEALACGAEPAAGYVAALIQAGKSGVAAAREVFEDAGRAIGIAAASISSFLRPDIILLAGGISEAGDCLIDPANRAFREHAAPFYLCEIRKARFGANAALIGAAAALLEES